MPRSACGRMGLWCFRLQCGVMEDETHEQWRERRERERKAERARTFKVLGLVLLAGAVVLAVVRIGQNIEREMIRTEDAKPRFNANRLCVGEKAPIDMYDTTVAELPDKRFRYMPIEGCFAKLVLPGFSHNWYVQTVYPNAPGWIAVKCLNGNLAFPPQSPNGPAPYGNCGYRNDRERNTFLWQGNVEVMFVTVDADASPSARDRSPSEASNVRPVPWRETLNFDKNRICNDALDKSAVIDHSEFDGDYLDVPLHEGCYGPTVRMPKTWNWWRHQSANDEVGWVSWSLSNGWLTDPIKLNEEDKQYNVDLDRREFRLQGKGTIRFIVIRRNGEASGKKGGRGQ